ncbi:hypothetical protein J437_LFUL016960 [Ladona fulva]|uniref:Uncharacterized protein n=1 Tax=Ladona fulva TaxID=123851 RepID=A0A8K0KL04_LADFU|nr:hypothetical protein J437_LFUL016960 [Ladona fulva]
MKASTPQRNRRQATLKLQSPGEQPGLPESQDSTVVQDSEPELQNEIEENDQVTKRKRNQCDASPEPQSPGKMPQDSPVVEAPTPKRNRRQATLKLQSPGEPPGSPEPHDSTVVQELEPVMENEIEENDQIQGVIKKRLDRFYSAQTVQRIKTRHSAPSSDTSED